MRLLLALVVTLGLRAESGYDAWLRYERLPARVAEADLAALGDSVTVLGNSEVLLAARDEYTRGVRGMLGRIPRHKSTVPAGIGVVLQLNATLPKDGFWIRTVQHQTIVAGGSDRGVLYGVFALLRKIALQQPIDSLDEKQIPYAPIRWVNHWDTLDGSIERDSGGPTIF